MFRKPDIISLRLCLSLKVHCLPVEGTMCVIRPKLNLLGVHSRIIKSCVTEAD